MAVLELVRNQCLQLVLREERTLLRVRADMKLRERVSRYLAVEVRTHHHAFEPHAVYPVSYTHLLTGIIVNDEILKQIKKTGIKRIGYEKLPVLKEAIDGNNSCFGALPQE